MKTYEATYSVKPKVIIHNPELLESVVCDEDSEFCQYLWEYTDLEDFVEHFALMFFQGTKIYEKHLKDTEYVYYKQLEGFGMFRQEPSGLWKLYDKEGIQEFGMIEVLFEEGEYVSLEYSVEEV